MIFRCIGIWNVCTINEDWLLFTRLVFKVNMYRFGLVEFSSPFFVELATLFTANHSFRIESETVSPTAMTPVSSASVAMVLFSIVGTSLV
jgi:hypothetical protein